MTGDAFAEAVTGMVQTLYRVSCSQLSLEADREDAVQETLRRAWEKRASLKNERYLQTWVIRILLNVCHDIQREKSDIYSYSAREQDGMLIYTKSCRVPEKLPDSLMIRWLDKNDEERIILRMTPSGAP